MEHCSVHLDSTFITALFTLQSPDRFIKSKWNREHANKSKENIYFKSK